MKGDLKLGLFLAALVAGVIAARPVLHAPIAKQEPAAQPESKPKPNPKKKKSDDPFLFPSDSDSDAAEVKPPASPSGWSNDHSNKSGDHSWQNDDLGKSKDDAGKLTMPAPQAVASATSPSGLTDVIPDGYPPPAENDIAPPAKLPAKDEPLADKTMLIDFAQKDEPAPKPSADALALPEPTAATTKPAVDDEPVTSFVPFITESAAPTVDAAAKGVSADGWEGASLAKETPTALVPGKSNADLPPAAATALSGDTPVVQSYDRRVDSPAAASRGKGPIHPFYQRYIDDKAYFVRPGDSLDNIAAKLYQDDSMAVEILKANRDQLPTAASIRPGMTLVLP